MSGSTSDQLALALGPYDNRSRPRDGGDDLIAEFEGTTPAFIRELLRRSALVAPSRPTGRCASRSATLRENHAELCAGPASDAHAAGRRVGLMPARQ